MRFMRRNIGRASVAAYVLVTVAGCGDPSTTTSEPPSTSSTDDVTASTGTNQPSSSTNPLPAPVPPAQQPSTASAPPGKVMAGSESSCTSNVVGTPIDLETVDVKVGKIAGRAGESAQVTMTYTGEVPATGTVLWSVLATNPEGAAVQLGYKTLDGQKIGYFYLPFAEGTQHNMDGFADTDTPGEIGMVLPQAGLDALGPVWWWSAAVNVDGQDVDFCPDPA